jgi:gluconokinase
MFPELVNFSSVIFMKLTRFILVMGVAGSGKTFIGKALANQLGWDFYDADDFHPPSNIAKMASGAPLNDDDRTPWLIALHQLISACLKENRPGVLACSALKEKYRQILLGDQTNVQIVYLKGSYELIRSHLAGRAEHFMKPEMLQSQFVALEEPADALTMDISLPVDEIVGKIILNKNRS